MKPIIKYRGGKSKEIPQIIQYMPQFDGRYIEPFLGGGAMFFHLEPNNAIIIIRKSKFPQNPKRSVRFSGKRTKRSVQKRKARNTQKAETKVL